MPDSVFKKGKQTTCRKIQASQQGESENKRRACAGRKGISNQK
jgi:hypothetical protein